MEKRDQLFRVKDVADLLDLTNQEVIALANSGKLKGIKEGLYWKSRLPDVMDYIRKK
jgi:predicted transcriptional regulator of viral defense system